MNINRFYPLTTLVNDIQQAIVLIILTPYVLVRNFIKYFKGGE